MKVFLTGASGILGTDIQGQLELSNYEVLGFNSAGIDITSYSDVKAKILDMRPDVVIHSAAMTNVDLCEDDKHAAIAANILGSQNLARAASHVNAKIVYISSCGVYGNGKETPYSELDSTSPLNFHHFTKLEAEKRVKEHHNDFLIIRPGWLFGGTEMHKKNFVAARRKEALLNPILESAADKIGSPTYTLDVADQIINLLECDLSGTFNVVNEGCASRFDYVSEIIRILGLKSEVRPVNSNSFPRKANMPNNECLENLYLNLNKVNKMRDWRLALEDYINKNY